MITQHRLRLLAASLPPGLTFVIFLAGCLPAASGPAGDATETRSHKVPDKFETVLKHIDEHHEAPNGYEGGREFQATSTRPLAVVNNIDRYRLLAHYCAPRRHVGQRVGADRRRSSRPAMRSESGRGGRSGGSARQ
jgi:hypothetical protein